MNYTQHCYSCGYDTDATVEKCPICCSALPQTPQVPLQSPSSAPPPSPYKTMPHARALFEEAHATISGPRRGDYGSVEESFRRIALTWSAVLGVSVTAQQVALCMVGLKICREANAHKKDSLVDIVGYTGLLAEMEGGK